MPIRTVVVNSLRHQFNIVAQTTRSEIIIGGTVIQQTDLKPPETPKRAAGRSGGKGLLSEWPPKQPKRKMQANGSHNSLSNPLSIPLTK